MSTMNCHGRLKVIWMCDGVNYLKVTAIFLLPKHFCVTFIARLNLHQLSLGEKRLGKAYICVSQLVQTVNDLGHRNTNEGLYIGIVFCASQLFLRSFLFSNLLYC